MYTTNKTKSRFLVKVKPPVESIVEQYKQSRNNSAVISQLNRTNEVSNLSNLPDILVDNQNTRFYSKYKNEVNGSIFIHEIMNNKIRDCFTQDFDGNTTVFQHKLYRIHPVVKKIMSLDAFWLLL